MLCVSYVCVLLHRGPGESQPEQVQEWIYTTSIATFVGFVAGGMYGTRVTADRFIASNQFGKFPSKMHAQVSCTTWVHCKQRKGTHSVRQG